MKYQFFFILSFVDDILVVYSALGTFKKYVRSRFPSFDLLPPSPLPLFHPCSLSNPPPQQGTSVLAGTHPISLNFYTCEIQRQETNEYQYLCLKTQWSLYKVETIGEWQKCLLYGDVLFMYTQSPSKNQKSSEVNIKSTICHDFPSPDLLEGPKNGKIKENVIFLF